MTAPKARKTNVAPKEAADILRKQYTELEKARQPEEKDPVRYATDQTETDGGRGAVLAAAGTRRAVQRMKSPDINEGVETYCTTPGAVLLDVRNPDEYAAGHIPGSVNLPLPQIGKAKERFPDRDVPLFVYCLSGGRSNSAIGALKEMGYANLTNIGGIRAWRGEIER